MENTEGIECAYFVDIGVRVSIASAPDYQPRVVYGKRFAFHEQKKEHRLRSTNHVRARAPLPLHDWLNAR